MEKKFKVNKIESEITIDGKGSSKYWNKANKIEEFSSPWVDNFDANTVFRALYSDNNFYFIFDVKDENIYIDKTDDSIESIGNSDRVEIFFKKDDNLNPYYCFEMDSETRMMDFKAFPNKNFEFDCNWPKGEIELKSHVTAEGYSLEGRISLESLNNFALIKDSIIQAGVYRAKFREIENSSNREDIWMPWVNPNTDEPNFHISSSFGIFELEK